MKEVRPVWFFRRNVPRVTTQQDAVIDHNARTQLEQQLRTRVYLVTESQRESLLRLMKLAVMRGQDPQSDVAAAYYSHSYWSDDLQLEIRYVDEAQQTAAREALVIAGQPMADDPSQQVKEFALRDISLLQLIATAEPLTFLRVNDCAPDPVMVHEARRNAAAQLNAGLRPHPELIIIAMMQLDDE